MACYSITKYQLAYRQHYVTYTAHESRHPTLYFLTRPRTKPVSRLVLGSESSLQILSRQSSDATNGSCGNAIFLWALTSFSTAVEALMRIDSGESDSASKFSSPKIPAAVSRVLVRGETTTTWFKADLLSQVPYSEGLVWYRDYAEPWIRVWESTVQCPQRQASKVFRRWLSLLGAATECKVGIGGGWVSSRELAAGGLNFLHLCWQYLQCAFSKP